MLCLTQLDDRPSLPKIKQGGKEEGGGGVRGLAIRQGRLHLSDTRLQTARGTLTWLALSVALALLQGVTAAAVSALSRLHLHSTNANCQGYLDQIETS